MSYTGAGIMESILDYKFLIEIGLEYGVYNSYNDMKDKIRTRFRENGINIVSDDKMGNKYYDGVREISRYTALELMTLKLGRKVPLNRYID